MRAPDALKIEGLVDIQTRRAPVVLSQDLQVPGMLTILERRDYILQVYETHESLLLYPLVFAARDYSIEITPYYRQAQRATRSGVDAESWKALTVLTRDILGASQNPLLCDLHTVFEFQGNFVYFSEKSTYPRGSIRLRPVLEPRSIIVVLQEQNLVEQFHHLETLYRDMYDIILEIFNQMLGDVSTVPAQISSTFERNPLRGRSHYCIRITRDLTRKIGTGIYAAGPYLPYEVRLARQYGVSVCTVRKALRPLERKGYAKTLSDKGAVVLTPSQLNTEQTLLDFITKQETLTYLHSLQLMVLSSYPVAAYTVPQFGIDDLNQLTTYIKRPGIFLADLLQMILERPSLKPLNAIWIETSRIVEWGFYLAFYPQGIDVIRQPNEITRNAYQYLCKGNHEVSAKNLADFYRLILSPVQICMVEKYKSTEASSVEVPWKNNKIRQNQVFQGGYNLFVLPIYKKKEVKEHKSPDFLLFNHFGVTLTQ